MKPPWRNLPPILLTAIPPLVIIVTLPASMKLVQWTRTPWPYLLVPLALFIVETAVMRKVRRAA